MMAPLNLRSMTLEHVVGAITKPKDVSAAFVWSDTPQNGEWYDYSRSKAGDPEWEHLRQVLVLTVRAVGREDLLPLHYQIKLSEEDYKEMV